MPSSSPLGSNYSLYAGTRIEDMLHSAFQPFSEVAVNFLAELSKNLMSNKEARLFPDIISFAFWCRRANLEKKKKTFHDIRYSVGRGLAFHIAPSNVPVNFAFSFAFSLLAGNSNIVRNSIHKYRQSEIIINTIRDLLDHPSYFELKACNSFIFYERDDGLNSYCSGIADCRLIWGGDQTVSYFKQLPTKPRNVDVCFADRFSFSIFGADKILSLNSAQLEKLCHDFFNDNFLFLQMACSSSHLIVWQGSDHAIKTAKQTFWSCINQIVKVKMTMTDADFINRFASIGSLALKNNSFNITTEWDDPVYRAKVENFEQKLDGLRVGYGYFSEVDNLSYKELAKQVNNTYQTITYFGIDPKELARTLISLGIKGVDRIVPVGHALSLDLTWDGYNLVQSLSRTIEVK